MQIVRCDRCGGIINPGELMATLTVTRMVNPDSREAFNYTPRAKVSYGLDYDDAIEDFKKSRFMRYELCAGCVDQDLETFLSGAEGKDA